jgi:hypothetical protein
MGFDLFSFLNFFSFIFLEFTPPEREGRQIGKIFTILQKSFVNFFSLKVN